MVYNLLSVLRSKQKHTFNMFTQKWNSQKSPPFFFLEDMPKDMGFRERPGKIFSCSARAAATLAASFLASSARRAFSAACFCSSSSNLSASRLFHQS